MSSEVPALLRLRSIVLLVVLLLLWLLRLMVWWFPEGRLWGFNHLLFLSAWWSYGYVLMGILAGVFCFYPLGWISERCFDRAGWLFERRRWWYGVLVAVFFGMIFWLLRRPTNFLGDGYAVISNLSHELPIIKWSEMGAIRIVDFVGMILPYTGLQRGEMAYAVVSVLSGLVTVWWFWNLSYELGEDRVRRLFVFCLLLFSGWALLFFGYAENYPVLWPFVVGYVYFSVRYLKGERSLYWPTLFLILSFILHLQVMFFSVSYLVLIFSRGIGRRLYKQYRGLVWSVLVGLFLSGVVIFTVKYRSQLEFRINFTPFWHSRPAGPGYTLLSPRHLLDIFNELSLLMPLWLALLVLGWGRWRTFIADGVGRFLLVFSLGGLGFLFIIDPRLGMAADWDMFALCGLGPLLLLSRTAITTNYRRYFPGMAVLSLLLVSPYFVTNLSYKPSIDYVKSLFKLDLKRSRSNMSILRDYYYNIGQKARGDSINIEVARKFPAALQGRYLSDLVNAGKAQKALELANAIYNANPYSAEAYNLRGGAYIALGDYTHGIADLEQSTKLAPDDHRVLAQLGQTYLRVGRHNEAMAVFRRSQKLSPEYIPALMGLASGFFIKLQFDSTLAYSEKAMAIDSGTSESYLLGGTAAFKMGNAIKAKMYLNKYLVKFPQGAERAIVEEILKRLP